MNKSEPFSAIDNGSHAEIIREISQQNEFSFKVREGEVWSCSFGYKLPDTGTVNSLARVVSIIELNFVGALLNENPDTFDFSLAKSLSEMRNLSALMINKFPISEGAAKGLSQHQCISIMRLVQCRFDGNCLAELSKTPMLEKVSLGKNNVSPDQVISFCKRAKLKELRILTGDFDEPTERLIAESCECNVVQFFG